MKKMKTIKVIGILAIISKQMDLIMGTPVSSKIISIGMLCLLVNILLEIYLMLA